MAVDKEQLFEQRFQRLGIKLPDVAVADHQPQLMRGTGERGEVGRVIRQPLECLPRQLD